MATKKRKNDEHPPLRMVIEKGRLVPAFPFDAERLDSYRDGTKMLVWMSADGDRPLVRRWWVTIGNYLKLDVLPWGDKESASAALKLALRIIEPFQTTSGAWSFYPRSLTEVDDKELETKILEMEQLLFEMTGVDVETLRAEHKDGEEEFNPPAPLAEAEEIVTEAPAATPRAADAGDDSGGDGASSPSQGSVAAAPDIPDVEVWYKSSVRMMMGCLYPDFDEKESRAALRATVRSIMDNAPTHDPAFAKRLESIRLYCVEVCEGKAKLDLGAVAKVAHLTIEEVTPRKQMSSEALNKLRRGE